MDHPAYAKLMEYAATPEALSASVDYLSEHLDFLKPNDTVLICFTRNQPYEIGSLFEKAVRARGAVPVFWEKDYRWKTLIRQAFQNNVSTVIGPPLQEYWSFPLQGIFLTQGLNLSLLHCSKFFTI